MGSREFAAAVVAFGIALGGCAATTTTSKVAVDYNRIFAKSRDEVLVTNILRASAREPLQFSTMGAVSGSVRNSGSITLPFTNLIGGGGINISPSASVADGINPTVSIVPLSSKEFTEGILTPVKLQTLEHFQAQGWDTEFLLSMVVGGVTCPDGTSVFNRGFPGPKYDAFVGMFQKVGQNPIVISGEDAPFAKMRMPAKEAAILLKDGAGEGRKITSVVPLGNEVEVVIVSAGKPQLVKLEPGDLCKGHQSPLSSETRTSSSKANESVILLRNAAAIIYFLGESQRYRSDRALDCNDPSSATRWPHYDRKRQRRDEKNVLHDVVEQLSILHLEKACRNVVPNGTFLRTRFNGANYFIRSPLSFDPSDESASCALDKPPQYCDRTLTTLSFLNELIALQTSGSTIEASKPVVTVEAK